MQPFEFSNRDKITCMEPPPSAVSRAAMIQQAKQELQVLEAQQPNKFNDLKLYLKQFISLMEIESVDLEHSNSISISSSAATTQCSSTDDWKKRNLENKSCGGGGGGEGEGGGSVPIVICLPCPENNKLRILETGSDDDDDDNDNVVAGVAVSISASKHKISRFESFGYCQRMDRVDQVITRARDCLLKIQHFKKNNCI